MKGLFFLAILILLPVIYAISQYPLVEEAETVEYEYLVFADTDECELDPDCEVIDITSYNFAQDFPTTDDWNSCYKVYKHYEFFIDFPEIEKITTERLEELGCYYLEIEHE